MFFSIYIDALSQASWARKSEASSRSHISDRVSLISSVPGGPDGDVRLTPQQYGVLGKSFFHLACIIYSSSHILNIFLLYILIFFIISKRFLKSI